MIQCLHVNHKEIIYLLNGPLLDLRTYKFQFNTLIRPWPIMLKILPIMLLSSAQKSSPLCSILCSEIRINYATILIYNLLVLVLISTDVLACCNTDNQEDRASIALQY